MNLIPCIFLLDISLGPTPAKRSRSDSNLTQQQYNQYQNTSFENSSSALLIDRMFAHLAKETEVMREWVSLERERLSQEVSRRREESEREERREKVFLQTLMKMQEQMFTFLSKQQLLPPSSPLTSCNLTTHLQPESSITDDHDTPQAPNILETETE